MATYDFDTQIIIGPDRSLARNAQVRAFPRGTTDFSEANALPITDLNGLPLPFLQADNDAVTPEFRTDGHPRVILASGPYRRSVTSGDALVEEVVAATEKVDAVLATATQAAADAKQAAEDAASILEGVESPIDGTPGLVAVFDESGRGLTGRDPSSFGGTGGVTEARVRQIAAEEVPTADEVLLSAPIAELPVEITTIEAAVRAVAARPISSGGGTNTGVYEVYSTDGGVTWFDATGPVTLSAGTLPAGTRLVRFNGARYTGPSLGVPLQALTEV